MGQITPAVLILIVINVGLFVINSITTFEMNQWFALFYPDNPQYGLWQYVTSMFMHGSVPHILFNMLGELIRFRRLRMNIYHYEDM